MTEKTGYIIQDYIGWISDWVDRDYNAGSTKLFETLEQAQKEMPTQDCKKSRIIKRIITEEIVVKERANKPPAPKFKVGDPVRDHYHKDNADNKYYIITEVVEDSYWTDGHRWNYRVKGINCVDPDPSSAWREYELRSYTLGGVKPKEHMSVVCLTNDDDLIKGQVYTVRKIFPDGRVEILDEEDDICMLEPSEYRLTV